MLRKETVEAGTLDLIIRLCSDENLKAFNLVGGTALALKIGHRKSIDIDLFSVSPFNPHQLSEYISRTYEADAIKVIGTGVFCYIDDIKIDLLPYRYPLLENAEAIEGVRMVSLLDIAAMKLNAIFGNGTRLKDFIDIYYLLEHFPLQKMLDAFGGKYGVANAPFALRALQHHENIDFTVPVDLIGKKIDWFVMAARLHKASRMPHLNFSPISAGNAVRRLLKINFKHNKGKRR